MAQAAWETFTSAQASIGPDELAVQANESAVADVQQEQRAGERSILDILNAQQELLAGQISLAIARHDTVVAAFQLLASTGQLTAQALALNVEIYDPLKHYNRDAAAWIGLDP